MAFWSGEKLSKELPNLIAGFDLDRVDCAAYTLLVGEDVYVTEEGIDTPYQNVKRRLEPNEQFKIPPGQYAFLLSEEMVAVPDNALALISIKSTYKFQGLVNVSGFHVDPGWQGRLVFGVFNAGPGTVVLSRGMPLFLIWYADLDRSTEIKYTGELNTDVGLPNHFVKNMGGHVYSPTALSSDIKTLRSNTETASHDIVSLKVQVRVLWLLLVGALIFGTFREPISRFFQPAESSRAEQPQHTAPQPRDNQTDAQSH